MLKQLIKEAELTQQALAALEKVTQATVSRWVNGQVNTPDRVLYRLRQAIANKSKVNAAPETIRIIPAPPPGGLMPMVIPRDQRHLYPIEQVILDPSLTPEEKEYALKIIESLAKNNH